MDTLKLTIEQQLQLLRNRWLVADPKGRKIIEIRAKLLKIYQIPKDKPETTEEIAEEVFKK